MSRAAPELLRVAVIGATGHVGRELLDLLAERRFPIQELRPIATDRSLGDSVEWLGHELPVEVAPSSLRGLDLAWLCTPPTAALDWMREALREEVALVDLSGVVAGKGEVPLAIASLRGGPWRDDQPVMASPSGPVLLLARVLAAFQGLGLARVQATVLESASSAGRRGVDALQQETIALFQQQEPEHSEVFTSPLAFDCLPCAEAPGTGLSEGREERLVRDLALVLGAAVPTSLTALRVPTFAGCGVQLSIEVERPTSPEEACDLLAKTPGVRLGPADLAPSTRSAIGSEVVGVGRVRADPSGPPGRGLQLWLVGDPVRLAAHNALELARSRFFPTAPETGAVAAGGFGEGAA